LRGEGLKGLAGLMAALGEGAEANGVSALGEADPLVGEFEEVPGGGLMNGVVRLPGFKVDSDAAGFVGWISLNEGGVDGERVQALESLTAEVVATNAAQ